MNCEFKKQAFVLIYRLIFSMSSDWLLTLFGCVALIQSKNHATNKGKWQAGINLIPTGIGLKVKLIYEPSSLILLDSFILI